MSRSFYRLMCAANNLALWYCRGGLARPLWKETWQWWPGEMVAGKNFPDGKSGFSENFPFPVLPGKYFPAQFRIFRFQNSKIHKNENRIFPTGFRCFPVGFRCFSGGKDCFSNVKNILVYMVLQKNYYTCIYNLNTKYPFKFRKNNISLT